MRHNFPDLSLPPRQCICAKCGCVLTSKDAERACGNPKKRIPDALPGTDDIREKWRLKAKARRDAYRAANPLPPKPVKEPPPPKLTPAERALLLRTSTIDVSPVPAWWSASKLEHAQRHMRVAGKSTQSMMAMRWSHAGTSLTIAEWASITSIPRTVLHQRRKSGWTIAECLRVPHRPCTRSGVSRVAKKAS